MRQRDQRDQRDQCLRYRPWGQRDLADRSLQQDHRDYQRGDDGREHRHLRVIDEDVTRLVRAGGSLL